MLNPSSISYYFYYCHLTVKAITIISVIMLSELFRFKLFLSKVFSCHNTVDIFVHFTALKRFYKSHVPVIMCIIQSHSNGNVAKPFNTTRQVH